MSKRQNNTPPPYTSAIETAAQMQRYITESQESIALNTTHRDDAIYSAHGSGHSIREIARFVGISHTQVKNVVDRCVAAGLTPHEDLRVAWDSVHDARTNAVYDSVSRRVVDSTRG